MQHPHSTSTSISTCTQPSLTAAGTWSSLPHALARKTVAAAALAAVALLSACNTVPDENARLNQARNEYRAAQDNPAVRDRAGSELKAAGDALTKANDAWAGKAGSTEVDHLAYLASQRVAIAQNAAALKTSEAAVANADSARDRVRLEARTAEAGVAQQNAVAAQREAEAAQRQAQAAQVQTASAQRDAADAQARATALEGQLSAMDARKTERGMVVTMGDVLFDTGKSVLKPGSAQNVDKLVEFLKQNPQRKALVEGHTDSVGNEGLNQDLSGRRADAVRDAMVGMGVAADRVSTRGYGEAHPVAPNDSADGRRSNRRVEIVLSDDSGSITPR